MTSALDLLMDSDSTAETTTLLESNGICTIDSRTRTIFVPPEIIVGAVQSDKNAERIKFSCPKIVGDNLDLSKFSIRINFENVSIVDPDISIKDQYICEDVSINGDNVTFSWVIGKNAARYMGTIRFIVCAVKTDSDSNISIEWNTTVAQIPVLEGIEVDQPSLDENNKDVINQLLAITKTASDEAVKNVNSAKEQAITEIQNVLQPDKTLTVEGGIADAKATGNAISSLREDLDCLPLIKSMNLFDKSKVVKGKFLLVNRTLENAPTDNDAFSYNIVKVEANTTYTITGTDYNLIVYSENGTQIYADSYDNGKPNYTFTTPSDLENYKVTYMGISYSPATYPTEKFMVVKGSKLPSEYQEFGVYYQGEKLVIPYKHKKITVAKDGSGDFTTVYDAVKYANENANEITPYDVYIIDTNYDGTFAGTSFDILAEMGGNNYLASITDTTDNRKGMPLNDYVNLKGVGKVKLYAYLDDNVTLAQSTCFSVIDIFGECYCENITFEIKNGRYAVHDETLNKVPNKTHKFKNCTFIHLGNASGLWEYPHAYAMGSSGNSLYEYIDCIFDSTLSNGYAFNFHNNQNQEGFIVLIDGCVFKGKNSDTDYSAKFGFLGYAPCTGEPQKYWSCFSNVFLKNILSDGKIHVMPESSGVCTNPYKIHNFTSVSIVIENDRVN